MGHCKGVTEFRVTRREKVLPGYGQLKGFSRTPS